jgi:hypothetical protein
MKKILKSSSLSLMSLVKSAEEKKKMEVLHSEANFIFSKIDDKGELLTKSFGDFRTTLASQIKIHGRKLKRLHNGYHPPLLDINEETDQLKTLIKEAPETVDDLPSSPFLFDWFEFPDLPPPALDSSTRTDWTTNCPPPGRCRSPPPPPVRCPSPPSPSTSSEPI